MEFFRNNRITVGIGIIVILFLGYFYLDVKQVEEPYSYTYDVSHITEESLLSYNIPDTYSDAEREKLEGLFQPWKDILERIGIDSLDEGGGPLLQIGILKLTVGDYTGAEEAWQYLYHLDPNGYLVNGNLGNLYYFYLKDFEKSEKYYLEALALVPIAPANHFTYISDLFDLYRFEIKDSKKAEALLDRALLEVHPSLIEKIKKMGVDYYTEKGDTDKAQAFSNKAEERSDSASSANEPVKVEFQ